MRVAAASGGSGGRDGDGQIGRRLRAIYDSVIKDAPPDLLSLLDETNTPPPAPVKRKRKATPEYRALRLAMHRIEAGWRPL